MNILYILGNGFDKAQGLATTYKEFYHDWLDKKPESELEQKVLSSIKGDFDTWADLEKRLGEYTAEWADEATFQDVLNLFNFRLKEYLANQESRVNDMNLSRSRLVSHLCQPEFFLEDIGRSVYDRYAYNSVESIFIDVVTLNYTRTFEYSLREAKRGAVFSVVNERQCYFNGILHLHGALDDKILVGVNDESQIANESFRSDEFLRASFIKPEINEGCMNSRNDSFSSKINNASIIVLFGVSVGITDNLWWQKIGERMNSKTPPLLLYFPFDPTKDTLATPNYKRIWSNQYISFLQDRMQIKQSKEFLQQSIRIGINKDFLKLVDKQEK